MADTIEDSKEGKQVKKLAKKGAIAFLKTPFGWICIGIMVFVLLLTLILTFACGAAGGGGSHAGTIIPEQYLEIKDTQEKDKKGKILLGLTPEGKQLDFEKAKYQTLEIPSSVCYVAPNAFSSDNVPTSFVNQIMEIYWKETPEEFDLLADYQFTIGPGAFKGLKNVAAVTLPDWKNKLLIEKDFPSFGTAAFSGCQNLLMFVFPQTDNSYHWKWGDNMLDGTQYRTGDDNAGVFASGSKEVAEQYLTLNGWKQYPRSAWGLNLEITCIIVLSKTPIISYINFYKSI